MGIPDFSEWKREEMLLDEIAFERQAQKEYECLPEEEKDFLRELHEWEEEEAEFRNSAYRRLHEI